MNKKHTRLHIYIEDYVYKWLKEKTKKESRSVSNYIKTLILREMEDDKEL